MKDPRASKRRRVSAAPAADEEGDIAMDSDEGDLYSVPSSPADPDSDDDQEFTPARNQRSRRRPTRGRNIDTQEGVDSSKQGEGMETPSRSGLRSSGRQRKSPRRYEDHAANTPPSSRRAAATPRSVRPTRSAQRPRYNSVDYEPEKDVDGQSPPPATGSMARTRSKRSTTKRKQSNVTNGAQTEDQSPSVDEFQDGLDDLVAIQLQQDLYQNQSNTNDTAEVADPLPDYAEKFQALCHGGFQDEVRVLTAVLLEKLSGKRQVPLRGLENEHQKVQQVIEQTVTVGEGNSMLLLGSRGCGKTAIVENIIASLGREHANDFHVVRLNGFLHTDDRLALREMWRQLGRETNTEEDAAKVSSYADTMATLLALLSHPEELFGASGNGQVVTAAKSVVIILDEFDLFATHPRQTLLYNLFDIAQARKAPIAVIGLTTKVDVTEMLEKRVKSRFSHRYVYVPLPRSFETFSDICLAGLDLEDSEVLRIAGESSDQSAVLESRHGKTLLNGWKTYLQNLWNDKDFQFHLKRIYNQTKSVKEFFTSALLPISDLHHSTFAVDSDALQVPTPKSFASQCLSCPDPSPLPFSASITASSSPSSLPLALLLAATRLAALFDSGLDGAQSQSLSPLALSFPAAYAEYVRLLTSAKTSASVSGAAATPGRVWGRDVAREAWEKLVSWGLVTLAGSGSGTADGQMFRVEISFEEMVEMAGSGGSLGQWWRDG